MFFGVVLIIDVPTLKETVPIPYFAIKKGQDSSCPPPPSLLNVLVVTSILVVLHVTRLLLIIIIICRLRYCFAYYSYYS